MLFLLNVNVSVTRSLVLATFDDTSSPSSPPRQVVYPLGFMVPYWVTASSFLAGNREAELRPTTFSSLLIFSVFHILFFSVLIPFLTRFILFCFSLSLSLSL